MTKNLEGFVSCVCVARDPNDLEKISDYFHILNKLHRDFEIIVCIPVGSLDSEFIQNHCNKTPSIAIYEISTTSFDALVSAGLELALGDWILELPYCNSLQQDTSDLFGIFHSDLAQVADAYQLSPLRKSFTDRLMSYFASKALEVPVHTMLYMPRLSKRSALQTWNMRKLRSKVLRVAPQLSRANVSSHASTLTPIIDDKRFIRIGLRTLAHSSAKPLRWISMFALLGAFLSVIISIVVLIVSINRNVVPGWTTTNLQISGLSFLILSVLAVLTEYIYQIAAAAIDQPTFRLVREFISPHYSFRTSPNVSKREEG